MTDTHLHGPTVNRIEWVDVYFTACAEKESFADVAIVTAKSEYANLAFQAAADIALKAVNHITPEDVMSAAAYLIDNKKIHIQEYVRNTSQGISVCINAVSVENDDVMWRALDMLADALLYLDGQHGTVYFGDNLHFSSSDLQLTTTH